MPAINRTPLTALIARTVLVAGSSAISEVAQVVEASVTKNADVECIQLDTTLYTESAIFRTCYKFTDRAYLFVRRDGADQIIVELRSKDAKEPLGDVAGAFLNELIDQQIRADLAVETQVIRDWVVAQAFVEADLPQPNLMETTPGATL